MLGVFIMNTLREPNRTFSDTEHLHDQVIAYLKRINSGSAPIAAELVPA